MLRDRGLGLLQRNFGEHDATISHSQAGEAKGEGGVGQPGRELKPSNGCGHRGDSAVSDCHQSRKGAAETNIPASLPSYAPGTKPTRRQRTEGAW